MRQGTNNYRETEILTATPQRLHLMLIEAALRSIERTRLHRRQGQPEEACETLIHAQQVVCELLRGINPQVDRSLAEKVSSLYLYVFRTLVAANRSDDEAKLDDARRVLEEQRETWRQLCEKLGASESLPPTQAVDDASTMQAGIPATSRSVPDEPPPSPGFSLEA